MPRILLRDSMSGKAMNCCVIFKSRPASPHKQLLMKLMSTLTLTPSDETHLIQDRTEPLHPGAPGTLPPLALVTTYCLNRCISVLRLKFVLNDPFKSNSAALPKNFPFPSCSALPSSPSNQPFLSSTPLIRLLTPPPCA